MWPEMILIQCFLVIVCWSQRKVLESPETKKKSRRSTLDSTTLETNTKNQRRGFKAEKAPLTIRLSLSIQKGRFHGDVARNDSGPVLLGYCLLEANESAAVTRDQKKSSAASQPSDIVEQEQHETNAKLSTPTSNLTDRLSPE